jgi:hypothetical protein
MYTVQHWSRKVYLCNYLFLGRFMRELVRDFLEFGAPREIRTPDQLVRSQLLYPAELWARGGGIIYT